MYRIALFHHKYGNDGVAKVLSELIPLYVKNGNEVILITEEESSPKDYFLPERVKRYTIESEYDILEGKTTLEKRKEQLRKILMAEQIDFFCHHTLSSLILDADVEVIKCFDTKLIGVKHELFSQWLVKGIELLSAQKTIFKQFDKLIVLSDTEREFWGKFGIECSVVINPLPYHSLSCDKNVAKHSILWVGRLDADQKSYLDALKVVSEVKKSIPDVVLHVYGAPDRLKDYVIFSSAVYELELSETVLYHGFSNNISEAYKKAEVMLSTSAYESFPMNIYESKAFGIPLVAYSMPYLNLLQDKKGYIEIPQKDIMSAANSIIEIMRDDALRDKLSKEAQDSLLKYKDVDLYREWETIFKDINLCREKEVKIEAEQELIWDTLFFHQKLLCQKYHDLEKENELLKDNYKLTEIKRIVKNDNREIVIYPSGKRAKELRELLEKNGLPTSFMLDNYCYDNNNIFPLQHLHGKDVTKYLFIIASDRYECGIELREQLSKTVPMEYQYDWFFR